MRAVASALVILQPVVRAAVRPRPRRRQRSWQVASDSKITGVVSDDTAGLCKNRCDDASLVRASFRKSGRSTDAAGVYRSPSPQIRGTKARKAEPRHGRN